MMQHVSVPVPCGTFQSRNFLMNLVGACFQLEGLFQAVAVIQDKE